MYFILFYLSGTNGMFSLSSSLVSISEYRDLRLDLGHIALFWVCFLYCPCPKQENDNMHWYFKPNRNGNWDGTWREVEDSLGSWFLVESLGFRMNCPCASKFRSFSNNPGKAGNAVKYFEFDLLQVFWRLSIIMSCGLSDPIRRKEEYELKLIIMSVSNPSNGI